MKLAHLKRYKDLAGLMIKLSRFGSAQRKTADTAMVEPDGAKEMNKRRARDIIAAFEALGPSYIKLGQFLSTRVDFFPKSILDALSRLQDDVTPFDFETVEQIVSAELGVRLSKAFDRFDRLPIASASLSQVHRACLRSGRQVAVKVQRPHIRDRILKDIEAMQEIAGWVDRTTRLGKRLRFQSMLMEFKKAMTRELDFRVEAAQLIMISKNLSKFNHIVVPQPVQDYTTGRILTMDYIPGRKMTELTPLSRTEFNGSRLADELFAAYLNQILIDGFYHADPHPGNLLITEDHKLALIDLGMTSRIPLRMRGKLLHFLFDLNEGRGEQASQHLLDISRTAHDFDERGYRRRMNDLVAKYEHGALTPMEIGRVVLDITRVCAGTGVIYPMDFALLGKTLMNLDQAARILDPEFDPNASLRKHAAILMRRRIRLNLNARRFAEAFVDSGELLTMLPERMNAFLERLAANELAVKVDVFDETYLMTGFQKIANRLTTGLILAALIIGAAMMMTIETGFTLIGYPGFAMVSFLIAGIGGLVLIFKILFQDETTRRKH